ncbi:Cytochrome c, class I [Shewanella piezotolerans WP3]|uniref:Cytochrome c, class I n=1 Tax=Shewanella piezotolerans (strain WP3 / JCM 13877) TaxID=225849 RepID=B8CQR7_SHEPW|nr:cytochrome c [Shewanella piezotolerans]ACJ30533.1 Cytochrome c, class I [Shewanella piezotolerans WP3]
MQHSILKIACCSTLLTGLVISNVQAADNSFKETLALKELALESDLLNYQADASKGEVLANQRCVACHGDAMLKMMSTYPNLKGQKGAYLFKQLVQFKRGERINPIMQGQASMLSETEMKDVALYYSQQTAVDLSQ